MKWAKLTTDPDLTGLTSTDITNSFKLYASMVKSKSTGKMEGILPAKPKGKPGSVKFEEWVTHPLHPTIKKQSRRDYMIFCGGWLQFYDTEVRKGKTDHAMHFEWNNKA